MIQSIRQYKNNDELINDLENNKNLVFVNPEAKEIFKDYLKHYGYFAFVKQYSNPLMYQDNNYKIFKKEFTSNNLRYLFDIDRNNSIVIFKYFRSVEFLLNSSILKVIAREINKKAKCPYLAALSLEDFENIFPNLDQNISNNKKQNKDNISNLYDDLFKNFNNKNFDSRDVIRKNKESEEQEIKDLIKNGKLKSLIDSQARNRSIKTKQDWEYLDIFSLFQILTFSQLIRIFSYLSLSLQNDVIKEFCNNFKPANKHHKLKSESFKTLIQILSDLRNILMHNGCLIKFKYYLDQENQKEIINNLSSYFEIQEEFISDIRLNEAIQIIELIIGIKGYILKEINESFQNKINRTTKEKQEEFSQLVLDIIEDESRIKIKKS